MDSGSAPFDPAEAGWARQADEGFMGLVGPLWRDADGLRFGFVAEPRHANMVGIVHGGMLMTLADRALGTIAWERAGDRPVVTIAFDMTFVHGARVGSFVEVAGEIVRLTSSLVFLRGLVSCGPTCLASCQGSWKILAGRPRRPGPGRAIAGNALDEPA